MADIQKWVKVTIRNFQEKFIICSMWGKWGFLGLKIQKMQKFHKICSLDFLKLYMMVGKKGVEKEIFFFFFQDNSDYAQSTPLWIFFVYDTFFNFSQNLFIRFPEILPASVI